MDESKTPPSETKAGTLRWRTQDEKLDTTEPVTALLLIADEEDSSYPHIIAGVYLWKNGQWLHEETFKPCGSPFLWVLEDELVATIRPPSSAVEATTSDASFLKDVEHLLMHIRENCEATNGPDFAGIPPMIRRIRSMMVKGKR